MKKFVIAGAAFAALIGSSAFAADMGLKAPAAPTYTPPSSWSGFYIGANGGYGWSQSSTTADPFQNFTTATPVIPPFGISQQLSGALAGVQLGYNYQMSAWVLGVEGDFDGAGLNNSSQATALDPLGGAGGTATDGFMAHEDIEWLATLRGRLGYTWGPSMLYVTGGGAWEGVKDSYLLSTDTARVDVYSASSGASITTTRSGWVVGGGWEWMINPNWIARLEYLHYDFSNSSSTVSIPVTCAGFAAGSTCGSNATSSNNSIDAVRVGLSYKFGR
jgi:outer membrane immunogenic protein